MAAFLSWAGHILKDIQLPLSTKMLVSNLAEDKGLEPSPVKVARCSKPLCTLYAIFLNRYKQPD